MVLGNCRGVLLIWTIVYLGPTLLAVGAAGFFFFFFFFFVDYLSQPYYISFFSYLRETAQYRLNYCLTEPLNKNKQQIDATEKHDG